LVLLDKSDDTISGVLNGLLTLTPPTSGLSGIWAIGSTLLYHNFILALKSGEGQADPDWGAFQVSALSGTWSISLSQALSHGNLYGQACPTGGCPENETPPATPLPGAAWLFGTVLASGAGFGAWRRRKREAATA
jgi:hypothetical protein